MIIKTLKYCLLLCFISQIAVAQSIIAGRVIDKTTAEPVPFAHVYIPNTSFGSISDLYGYFVLEVAETYNLKTLQISCLGYKSLAFEVDKSGRPILIKLEEDVIRLDEVVITPETGENVMRKAFAKIPENYDTTALIFKGYYKMESKVDTSEVRSIEALLDIYKTKLSSGERYGALPSDSIYADQVNAHINEEIDFKLKAMVDWENTPYLLGYRDFVREFAYVDKSPEKMLGRYDFEVENMVLLQGRRTYAISVIPKKGKTKAYWEGKIFIDEETMAFAKIDVISSPKMFKKLKTGLGYKLQSKINNLRYDSGQWKESVSYTFDDGKWHFSRVNSSKQFLISSKKRGMEKVPATVNVQFKTLNLEQGKYVYDSVHYFPQRKEGYWKVEKFMEANYDSTFWNQFDRTKIMSF